MSSELAASIGSSFTIHVDTQGRLEKETSRIGTTLHESQSDRTQRIFHVLSKKSERTLPMKIEKQEEKQQQLSLPFVDEAGALARRATAVQNELHVELQRRNDAIRLPRRRLSAIDSSETEARKKRTRLWKSSISAVQFAAFAEPSQGPKPSHLKQSAIAMCTLGRWEIEKIKQVASRVSFSH